MSHPDRLASVESCLAPISRGPACPTCLYPLPDPRLSPKLSPPAAPGRVRKTLELQGHFQKAAMAATPVNVTFLSLYYHGFFFFFLKVQYNHQKKKSLYLIFSYFCSVTQDSILYF